MLERARLAARRLLTMANLFENLSGLYGSREAVAAEQPLGYRFFPSSALGYRDCLHFTNLAAEAFIRRLDLKKGERAVLCVPEPAEKLLLAAALVKAGGIAVPADHRLPAEEMARRVLGCGATLAVVDGSLLAERPALAESMPGVERIMASGPRRRVPEGVPSLDAAMDASSGFFLPYTLKPDNVVGLFYAPMRDGSRKAVMATNRMLLGPQLTASLFLPVRAGDRCLCALPLDTLAGFSAAVLALTMGLHLRFLASADGCSQRECMREERPRAVMAGPEFLSGVFAARTGEPGLAEARLWYCAGELPDPAGSPRPRGLPALLVEAGDARGNASIFALRASLLAGRRGLRLPGIVLPPNRAGVVNGAGRKAERGRNGGAAVKGPAVTPGYWNDLEGTLEARRGAWLLI